MSAPHEATRRPGPGAVPPAAPPLASIAELVHQGTADDPADLVVMCGYGAGSVDVGLWPIPPEVDHPTDVLLGWNPPTWASVVGLVTTGEARSQDSIDSVRVTVVTSRAGHTATVLSRGHRPAETLVEAPQGWGADALRRCFGLATPAPTHGLRCCVEGSWLEAVAGLIAQAPTAAAITWDHVALVHPLHPPGWPAAPVELRAATAALEAESSWERLTEIAAPDAPLTGVNPPGGTVVPLHEWFDAGAFSRWTLRRLPDLEDLLFEVLERLAPNVAESVLDALLSTTAWQS